MKKTLLIVLILSVLPFSIFAQDLSPKMAAFKDFCVRTANAAVKCDVDELALCIENWEPAETDGGGKVIKEEKFVYNNEEIKYIEFGSIENEDTANEEILGMHFGFTPYAVDNWITNKCEVVALADANMLRGDESNLEYTVRALKAHSKAVYSTRGSGNIEVFVVAENGGKVNLSIHAVEKDRSGNVKETDLTDNSGAQTAQLKWSMDRNGKIEFTVENVGDKEISFILVKSM